MNVWCWSQNTSSNICQSFKEVELDIPEKTPAAVKVRFSSESKSNSEEHETNPCQISLEKANCENSNIENESILNEDEILGMEEEEMNHFSISNGFSNSTDSVADNKGIYYNWKLNYHFCNLVTWSKIFSMYDSFHW